LHWRLALAGGGATALSLCRREAMDTYSESTRTMRAALAADPDARQLVRFAMLAANGHNAQPWKFHLASGRICQTLFICITERLPIAGFGNQATSQFATRIVIETT
jgi:nitroreductase